MNRVAAVITHSPFGTSEGEILVQGARRASVLDLVAILRKAGLERILLVSGYGELVRRAETFGVEVVPPPRGEPFHLGQTLKRIVAREGLHGLLYFGSGSGGLMTVSNAASLMDFAEREEKGALLNNYYSCDFGSISAADELLRVDLPQIDNSIGFALSDAGWPCYSLPRDVVSQFDIDTPTDLLLLQAADQAGPAMRSFLKKQELANSALSRLVDLLPDRSAHLLIIGRLNPTTWGHFERGVACRTSAIAEGRGIRAYPSQKKTLAGAVMHREGVHAFFEKLSWMADAAIIDSRPVLSEERKIPGPADRFASDMLRPQLVGDRLWREFTEGAVEAPIPVLLGGHSMVNGGLYLLSEACWKDRDLACRLHPDIVDW